MNGLLRRGARHRARIRATRWLLAMTAYAGAPQTDSEVPVAVTVFIYQLDPFKRAMFEEGVANFNFAEENKFIVAEERKFLRQVVSESVPR
jgi:hypothetical protein